VIELAAGTYNAVALNNLHFDGAVTVTSADTAHEAAAPIQSTALTTA